MRRYLLSAAALVSMAGAAHADDQSLTVAGITIYGVVDMGIQYETHGAPLNDYFLTGTEELIQKNAHKSLWTATPSNLGQSKIGIKGAEDLVDGLTGIFRLETFFNPTSGNISDALKSMTQNNGRPLDQQTSNADSSIAGQMFNSAAIVGLSSPRWGTGTFGRQTGLLADGVAKYDPLAASNAFSPIGWSGAAAGSGDTQDRRFDNSLKYLDQFGPVRAGAMYKFSGYGGSAYSAYEFDLGADYAHFSVDGFYAKIKDAINLTSPLTAVQVAQLPALGFSSDTAVTGTVSDNETFSLMALYDAGKPKAFFGYEHIEFGNPSHPLQSGFDDIGGYTLVFPTNNAYAKHKILQIYWLGAKYAVTPKFDVSGAWYHYDQNSYATGANAGCTTTVAGNCAGSLNALSLVLDYHFSKRFDSYAGAMWSQVLDGLGSGYFHNNNIAPTVGLRFTF